MQSELFQNSNKCARNPYKKKGDLSGVCTTYLTICADTQIDRGWSRIFVCVRVKMWYNLVSTYSNTLKV